MQAFEKLLVAAITSVPLVAVPVGALLLKPDTGDLNRNPMPFPDLVVTDLLQAEGYASIASWLRDRVPLRRQIRAVDANIDRGLFGDIDDEMIVQGQNGWLYFEPALGYGLNPDFDPADVRAGILAVKSQVEAAGKTFLYAFAPHKPTVHPEHLGERDARRQTIVDGRLEDFRDLMRREPVAGYLDAWDTLRDAARTAPEPLYYPRDTHWTPLGARAMTDLVVHTLDPGIDTTLIEKHGKPRAYVPDLARYSGLDTRETIRPWTFEREGVRTKRVETEAGAKTRVVQFRSKSETGVPLLPKIAIICDSYGTALYPSLSRFFRKATFIHVQSGSTGLAQEALAEADIVLFLRVERFLWQTGAEMPFAADSAEVLELLSTLKPDGATDG